MATPEQLTRKIRVRAGHRASATRMRDKITELIAGRKPPEPTALAQLGMSLKEKLEVLKTLDAEVLELTEEDALAPEIEKADKYKEEIYAALARLEEFSRHVTAADALRARGPPDSGRTPTVNKVKLPKLSIKPFNGNLTAWTSFWDTYQSAIHDNPELSNIDKFNYLKSLLGHSAAEAIAGLALTGDNYLSAIDILKKRFGNKQQIISKHMEQLLHVNAVTSQYDLKGLRHLYDTVESNVRGLRALGVASESYGALLSSVLMTKLPNELRLIVSRKVGEDEWQLDELMEAVEAEVRARERTFTRSAEIRKPREQATAAALLTTQSCCYCHQEHSANACTSVADVSSRMQILRRSGRCFVCLRRGHRARDCRSSNKCYYCKGRHHASLCQPKPKFPAQDDSGKLPLVQGNSGASNASEATHLNPGAAVYTPPSLLTPRGEKTSTLCTFSNKEVLLQTARVTLFNPDSVTNHVNARVVLDTGSQRSYLTDRVKTLLALTPIGTHKLSIMTFGAARQPDVEHDYVKVGVRLRSGESMFMTMFSVPTICEPILGQPITCYQEQYPHLHGLDLADDAEEQSSDVDVLVGSDFYWDLITGQVRRGATGPVAIHTRLGWVLSGPTCKPIETDKTYQSLMTHTLRVDTWPKSDQQLAETLSRFWELESLGISVPEKSLYDDFRERIRFKNGRYEVALPWKQPCPDLANNYKTSLRRLEGLLNRLRQDTEALQEYDKVIRDQVQHGIVEEVSSGDIDVDGVHYLPHHAVIRRDKATTRLRIVFDASAKVGGISLNDCLFAGPKFDQNVFELLLRFRAHRVAVMADIEKAFLQIAIAERDRDYLRFLWINSIKSVQPEIRVFRFARVAFGVTSSPFLLNGTIKYHLESNSDEYPELVAKLLRSTYVDDVVTSVESEERAYEFYQGAKELLKQAGFNLRKFSSNSRDLQLEVNVEESSNHLSVNIEKSGEPLAIAGTANEQKVLGVRWNIATDHFIFSLNEIAEMARALDPTKRNVISLIGKFFDPIGFLSPIVVKYKIFMQALCEAKISWDDPLSGNLLIQWQGLVSSLLDCPALRIPRCYLAGVEENPFSYTLLGYCDASLSAYAAVIYLQIQTEATMHFRLVAAKTRVSPLKRQSVPRLELLSALLLARLITAVSEGLQEEIPISAQQCFTDSTVALYWIQGADKSWKPFVQNRVKEIRSLVPIESWNHCSGIQNPADIPSRGVTPRELMENILWFEGPLPLVRVQQEDSEDMPQDCASELRASEKQKTHNFLTVTDVDVGSLLQSRNFSSMDRLLGVATRVLKFCSILRCKANPHEHTWFEDRETLAAEQLLVKSAQASLTSDRNFEQWKRQLTLFLDDDGIWRCQGRIENATAVPYSAKHPILLPRDHHLTQLYIRDAHNRVFHNGVKDTLTELRSRFWIITGRSAVRRFIHRCTICRRFEGVPYKTPPPPPLPAYRVQQAPPFSHTGVDFAGPLFVKSVAGTQKSWIVLYTCCVTRALHLDLVPDMSTPTFIRSFKRFAARRGLPAHMVSDNGKTFKAAAKILRKVVTSAEVTRYFQGVRIKWTFNVPKAPWWGGFFERMVRSVKRCLKKTLGQAKLSYDELLTALVEVEMVLNSRPLTYVSSDDTDEPLTPSHLLVGRRIMSLPDDLSIDEDLDDDYHTLPNRVCHLNKTLNSFWARWQREYLLELREAHRYHRGGGNPQVSVGDIVVVHGDSQPRSCWRLGKVERIILGRDDQIRAATVRVFNGHKSILLQRPVQRLFPLEIQAQDNSPAAVNDEITRTVTPDCGDDTVEVRRSKRTAAAQARDQILAQAMFERDEHI